MEFWDIDHSEESLALYIEGRSFGTIESNRGVFADFANVQEGRLYLSHHSVPINQVSSHVPCNAPSNNLITRTLRISTINLQDILFVPSASIHHRLQKCCIIYLRTCTDNDHQIHLRLQANIFPRRSRRSVEAQTRSIFMDRYVHEQVQRLRSELWWLEA